MFGCEGDSWAQCLVMSDGEKTQLSDERPQRPPWLIGLILAIVIFIVIVVLANILGFGDDPSLGAFG